MVDIITLIIDIKSGSSIVLVNKVFKVEVTNIAEDLIISDTI